jgi:hypothetical protein
MSVYQCPECGEQGKKYDSVLPSDIEEGFCPSCRSFWDIGLKSDNTNDHAEVGALLAKCGNYRVAEYESGWHAEVYLIDGGMGSSEFAYETQLAAIRAAVEAAEKGVRE